MRLIDADAFLEEINNFSMRITGYFDAKAITVMEETKKSVAKMISEQPTAYDIDKVVGKLEDLALEHAIAGQQYGEDGWDKHEKEEQAIKQGIEAVFDSNTHICLTKEVYEELLRYKKMSK